MLKSCPFQKCSTNGRFVCHCNKEKTEVTITGMGMRAGQEIEKQVKQWKDLFSEIKGANISSQVENGVCKILINLLDCKEEDREQITLLLQQEFKCIATGSPVPLPSL